MLSRKEFLITSLLAAFPAGLTAEVGQTTAPIEDLKKFLDLVGVEMTDEEIRAVATAVRRQKAGYEGLRSLPISYRDEFPLVFTPLPGRRKEKGGGLKLGRISVKRPRTDEDVAYMSVRELGELLRTKQITSLELTQIYLSRMKKYGDALLCLVTLTEDLALKQAKAADAEIASGKYRGPLHGIPCGVKDLLATKGIPTTWGAEPYKDQVFDYDATVITKLQEAGAVLIAKLSMGALAQGDVWFKGRTKNPWNPQQGSSGSSAGPGAAVAAGLVGFAIGTETLGSICSPSERCRVSGHRPTYGRVSRNGAMAVSWTMDKIGPMARTIEDCAIVFQAIHGEDPMDASSVSRPFQFDSKVDFSKLKIGVVKGQSETDMSLPHLKALTALGANLTSITLDNYASDALIVLGVEAAVAFDEFTRSDAIDKLTNSAWPGTYRSNRFVPAVEYLRAQQARKLLMHKFEEQLGDYDALVTTGIGNATIRTTNLTGHPQAIFRYGEQSVSLVGRLYEDGMLLS
ncbi:MAG: amidase, partial [Fimbriimonadaceae bacterium]